MGGELKLVISVLLIVYSGMLYLISYYSVCNENVSLDNVLLILDL